MMDFNENVVGDRASDFAEIAREAMAFGDFAVQAYRVFDRKGYPYAVDLGKEIGSIYSQGDNDEIVITVQVRLIPGESGHEDALELDRLMKREAKEAERLKLQREINERQEALANLQD